MFALSIFAGYLLWRQQKRGYQLSIFIQTLQLPIIITKLFVYDFIVGLQLALGVLIVSHIPAVDYSWYLGSKFVFQFDSPIRFGLYINVVALVFLIILHKAKKKQFQETASPSA